MTAASSSSSKDQQSLVSAVSSSASGLLSSLTSPSAAITQSLASSQAETSKASSSSSAALENPYSSSSSTSSHTQSPWTTSSSTHAHQTSGLGTSMRSMNISDDDSFASAAAPRTMAPLHFETFTNTFKSTPWSEAGLPAHDASSQGMWDHDFASHMDGQDVVNLLANNTMTSLGIVDDDHSALAMIQNAWNDSQSDMGNLDSLFGEEEDVTEDPVEWLNLSGAAGEYTEYVWGDKKMGKRPQIDEDEIEQDVEEEDLLSQSKGKEKMGGLGMKSRL